jgi:hypothetical protein
LWHKRPILCELRGREGGDFANTGITAALSCILRAMFFAVAARFATRIASDLQHRLFVTA